MTLLRWPGNDDINVLHGVDRVFYTDVLDAGTAGDFIRGWSTSGTTTQDYLVLDVCSIHWASRPQIEFSRVSFTQDGGQAEVWIDTDGLGGGDLLLCTLSGTTATTLSAGNLATNDVLVGT